MTILRGLRSASGFRLRVSGGTVAPSVPVVSGITLTPAIGTANSAAGTVIGTLTATVSGPALVSPVWTLLTTAGGDFQIVNGNQVAVLPSNVPTGSYSVTAQVAASNLASPYSASVGITINAVTGDWDALTPYSQVALGFKNASSTALSTPFVMTNHRAQRGDIPSGYRLGLFTADGTAIPTQQDNEALAYADGSLSSATIAAVLPNTLAATGGSGDTGSYFVKAVQGAPDRTPKFGLASWAAQNDLKLRICTNIANLNDATAQFEFRVRDAVSAGLYEGSSTGSDYPLTSIHVDRSGPVCMGWKFKGFARRVSDGAYHRTLTGEVYVTATSLTDMLIDSMFKMAIATTAFGGNPAQTVGPTTNEQQVPIQGVVQLWNGSTLLHTWGGPTDFRATPITVDVTNNQIIFPTGSAKRSHNSVGYVFTSSGTLPGGVVANHPYYTEQAYDNSKCYMKTRRSFTRQVGDVSVYQAGQSYDEWRVYGNGVMVTQDYDRSIGGDDGNWRKVQQYAAVQGGTTAGTPPSGPGFGQVDGSVIWDPLNLKLTSAGSGTITVYPVVHVFPACGAAFVDELTTDPIWTGSAPAPRVEAIKDLTYLCRYARALPPYDLTLSPIYDGGVPFDGFSVSEPYVNSQIDNFGDDPGTNLIGYLNISAAVALLAQTSVQAQRHQRAEAFGWGDHWVYLEDARSLQPVVVGNGPGNAAGRYAGLGPSMPAFWFDYRGIGGSGFLGLGKDLNGQFYDAKYQTMLDGSHMPAFWILSYEKTGRAIFLDQGIALANGVIASSYKGNNNPIAGRTYTNTTLVNQQIRGSGWTTRCIDTLDDVLPATHPLRTYFSDVVQDGLDFALATIEYNRTHIPEAYALGYIGIDNSQPTMQMWMMAYYLTATGQAARKGRHPEYRTITEFIATRLYLRLYDDDTGGNVGLIDWNNFAGVHSFKVADGVKAGDTFTTVAEVDPNGLSAGNSFTPPSAITYTATSGQTPAQVATAICNMINNTPSTRDFGWLAVDDDPQPGWFRVNLTSGLFSTTNNHGDVSLNIAGPSITRSGNQVYALGRLDDKPFGSIQLRTRFDNIYDMLQYNLGPNWPQTAQNRLSLSGTNKTFQGSVGRVPWDTVEYPTAHWSCCATLCEAGITKARTIYDRMTARIQATGGGPTFTFAPGAAGNRFDPTGTGRTFNNFNLVAYHLQATRTGH